MCVELQQSLFNFWDPFQLHFKGTIKKIKGFILNFGPQHPAAHGVLRLVLQLNGEVIEKSDAHIGFLHRGTEKLIETKNYLQAIPYFDRLDYVSMMCQEHAFCLAIEQLLNTTSYSASYVRVRVLFDELTRLLNHFLAVSTHSLDVGNMSPLFWAFEEREKIMEFYERVSGARMHAAFYRPNDLDWTGLDSQLFTDIAIFTRNTLKSLGELFTLLASNRIWKTRLVNIGIISRKNVSTWGASGPVARSAGVKTDIRIFKTKTYATYWQLNFSSYLGTRGDSYDRFLIRIREMFESTFIILQLLSELTWNTSSNKRSFNQINNNIQIANFSMFINDFTTVVLNKWKDIDYYVSMEQMIEHFKYYSEGFSVPRGFTYASIESPKGEFGVSLISDGSCMPYRCKIRSPAYHHLQMMTSMMTGHYMVDMITILGSQDIVFGEVDR